MNTLLLTVIQRFQVVFVSATTPGRIRMVCTSWTPSGSSNVGGDHSLRTRRDQTNPPEIFYLVIPSQQHCRGWMGECVLECVRPCRFLFVSTVQTTIYAQSLSNFCVVMSLDSHPTVSTFHSWFVLLGAAIAFSISILKIYKLPLNYCHRVTNITSFVKHLGNFSDHTLNFYENLVLYFFKNM